MALACMHINIDKCWSRPRNSIFLCSIAAYGRAGLGGGAGLRGLVPVASSPPHWQRLQLKPGSVASRGCACVGGGGEGMTGN